MNLITAVAYAVNSLFNIIYALVLIRVFSSWMPFLYENAFFSKILYMIESLTEPIMAPVRNMIARTRFGQMPLDFSPVIVLLLLQFVQGVIQVLLLQLLKVV